MRAGTGRETSGGEERDEEGVAGGGEIHGGEPRRKPEGDVSYGEALARNPEHAGLLRREMRREVGTDDPGAWAWCRACGSAYPLGDVLVSAVPRWLVALQREDFTAAAAADARHSPDDAVGPHVHLMFLRCPATRHSGAACGAGWEAILPWEVARGEARGAPDGWPETPTAYGRYALPRP